MQMIEVKTADLIGPALNWAVAKVEHPHGVCYSRMGFVTISGDGRHLRYSTDWAQGGPLLAKHFRIVTGMVPSLDMWPDDPAELLPWVMRKIVEFELGDVVSVPAVLVSQ